MPGLKVPERAYATTPQGGKSEKGAEKVPEKDKVLRPNFMDNVHPMLPVGLADSLGVQAADLGRARVHFFGEPFTVIGLLPPAALDLPESEWPVFERERKPRPNGAACRLFEQLRARRDAVAKDLAVDPSLIASRQTLMSVAQQNGARLLPWQRDLLKIDEPVGH